MKGVDTSAKIFCGITFGDQPKHTGETSSGRNNVSKIISMPNNSRAVMLLAYANVVQVFCFYTTPVVHPAPFPELSETNLPEKSRDIYPENGKRCEDQTVGKHEGYRKTLHATASKNKKNTSAHTRFSGFDFCFSAGPSGKSVCSKRSGMLYSIRSHTIASLPGIKLSDHHTGLPGARQQNKEWRNKKDDL